MKKLYLCVLALAFTATAISAQTFKKGDFVANVGLGVTAGTYYGGMSIPPLSASVEYGILDNLIEGKGAIGVGGYTTFAKYGGFSHGTSVFHLGARGNFHYEFVEKLDTYAGLTLGFTNISYIGGGIGFGGHIGARYYFSEKLAAFAELGHGVSTLQLGIAFKL